MNRDGVWHRAGMEGGISGLDWPAAIASLPAGIDMEVAKQLMSVLEPAYLQGWWAYAESQRPSKGNKG